MIRRLNKIRTIHYSRQLLKYTDVKLTFFSKPNCGLCEEAKEVIDDVLGSSDFEKENLGGKLEIVNINKDKKWWNAYCFDIPVLHIEDKNDTTTLVKIMHHFREDELSDALKKFR